MLTPVNYFDYDITMESRDAILIHPLQERDVFEFDDNGEKQNFHCLPMVHPFLNILILEWLWMGLYTLKGRPR